MGNIHTNEQFCDKIIQELQKRGYIVERYYTTHLMITHNKQKYAVRFGYLKKGSYKLKKDDIWIFIWNNNDYTTQEDYFYTFVKHVSKQPIIGSFGALRTKNYDDSVRVGGTGVGHRRTPKTVFDLRSSDTTFSRYAKNYDRTINWLCDNITGFITDYSIKKLK